MVQSQESRALTIGRLAREGAVGVETVRFYQRKGLLGTPARHEGFRRYGADDLRRLRFIRQAQAAGFALNEIGELLALDSGQDRPRVRELARIRIAALNAKIAQMEAARDALERLAAECGAGRKGACPILKSFEV